MTRPKHCTDLTTAQRATYQRLNAKPELNEKDIETLDVLNAKIQRFNDPELSAAAKKYLIKRYSWAKYNKGTLPAEQKSSFLVKGNELEQDGIEILKQKDGIDYERPTEFTENGFLFGRCDIISRENRKVLDVKVSWSIHSFLPNYITKLSEKYWWQMQGYMELYDADVAQVRYVLLNTPAHLIERERSKHVEKYLFGEIDSEKFEEEMEKLDLCYDYTKIPDKRKIITYEFEREPSIIPLVYKKIEKCREWLSEFDSTHVLNKKIVTSMGDYAIQSKENNPESDSADSCESDTGG